MSKSELNDVIADYRALRAPALLGQRIEESTVAGRSKSSWPLAAVAACLALLTLAIVAGNRPAPSIHPVRTADTVSTSLPSLNVSKPRIRAPAPRVRPSLTRVRTPKRPRLKTPVMETKNVKT
jgi:hypothetical protein